MAGYSKSLYILNMKCLGGVFLVNVIVNYESVMGETNVISGTRPNMFCHFPPIHRKYKNIVDKD